VKERASPLISQEREGGKEGEKENSHLRALKVFKVKISYSGIP